MYGHTMIDRIKNEECREKLEVSFYDTHTHIHTHVHTHTHTHIYIYIGIVKSCFDPIS